MNPQPEKITLSQTIQTVEVSRPTHNPNRKTWERLPDESALWYERFICFRDLPVQDRNVWRAHQVFSSKTESDRAKSSVIILKKNKTSVGGVHSSWYEACDRYKWEQRATDYLEHTEKLIRETKEREIQKIVEKEISEQYAIQKEGDKMIVGKALADIRLMVEEGKRLKPSEAINFYRIGVSNQHELNEILAPKEDKHSTLGHPSLSNGHISESMQRLLDSMEDGRPAEVVEMERKLRESEQAPAITQATPQEAVVWEEP